MGESVVTGLRPWAVYQLRVFAENQLGKSKEGKVLQVGKINRMHNVITVLISVFKFHTFIW